MKLAKKNERRSVFPDFRSIMDDFWGADKFFENDWINFPRFRTPAVNIVDNEGDFQIEVAAPGLNKEDFKIEIDHGILNISAEKEETVEKEEKDFTRREFNYSSFHRSFSLPENVDKDSILAKYEDGVLKLTVKKLEIETPKAKSIAIQ